jgi:protoporphyrinogen oxidase
MARVAVIGAGWAGLSAAVALCDAGLPPTVFEMAAQPGGRARSLSPEAGDGVRLDNGQHILIGAYTHTLALMRHLGIDPDHVLRRSPLTLIDPEQHGLRLPKGPPLLAFSRAVLAASHWPWGARLSLLRHSLAWLAQGFPCEA